jgi:peptidoglycan/xylan/chitin deacetylase (PgdA/CDA1 family)
MKITTLLVSSALFLATMTTAQVPAFEAARVSKCRMPGVVAYTFDDGPYIYNDQLLAILKKKNVTATFFLV